MISTFFKSQKYYKYISGVELIQILQDNKLSNKQKKVFVEYILNYKNYKIQILDIFKIKISKHKLSYKKIWKIDDLIIDYSTSDELLHHLIEPVQAA